MTLLLENDLLINSVYAYINLYEVWLFSSSVLIQSTVSFSFNKNSSFILWGQSRDGKQKPKHVFHDFKWMHKCGRGSSLLFMWQHYSNRSRSERQSGRTLKQKLWCFGHLQAADKNLLHSWFISSPEEWGIASTVHSRLKQNMRLLEHMRQGHAEVPPQGSWCYSEAKVISIILSYELHHTAVIPFQQGHSNI
jgi:hypothetical protein